MALKFYTSVTKGLKLKVAKFCWLIPTFVEVTGDKLVRGLFAPPPILNRVKEIADSWACVQDTKYCVMIYIVICRVLYRKLLALVRFMINFHCRSGFSLCSSKHFSEVGCSLLMKDWISQLFICSKQNIWWFLLNYLIKSLGGEYIITS